MTRKQFITEVENRFTNCRVSNYYEMHDTGCERVKGFTHQYAVVCDLDEFDTVKALRGGGDQRCYYAVWTLNGKLEKLSHPATYLEAVDFVKCLMF